jgi:hypothetical protein
LLFEKYKILKNNNIVKKDIIPLGLIFCRSSNKGKIQILYDLNSNPNFEKNDILFQFLKNIFLLCLIAEYSTKKSFDEKFSEEDNNEIIKISEDLANKFLSEFFKDKNEIDYKDFEKKFKIKTNDFGWIFNPNGIRNKIKNIKNLKNDLTNLTIKENDIILNNDIIINDEDIKIKKNVIIEDIKEETKNDNKNEKKLKSKKKNIINIQNETKKNNEIEDDKTTEEGKTSEEDKTIEEDNMFIKDMDENKKELNQDKDMDEHNRLKEEEKLKNINKYIFKNVNFLQFPLYVNFYLVMCKFFW